MTDSKHPTWPPAAAGKWIPSWMTDVQRTWRKFGWVPPSEVRAKKAAK